MEKQHSSGHSRKSRIAATFPKVRDLEQHLDEASANSRVACNETTKRNCQKVLPAGSEGEAIRGTKFYFNDREPDINGTSMNGP